MKISIETIPHSDQRYNTCGDYFYRRGVLCIRVSELTSRHEMACIAVHELVEALLCEAKGVSFDSIDKFDKQHSEINSFATEPGDDVRCPYYREHQIATVVERLLAAELGVNWLSYENHVKEL